MKKLWLLLLLLLPLGGCVEDIFTSDDFISIFGYPAQEFGVFAFYPLFTGSGRSSQPLKLHVAPKTTQDWNASDVKEIEQGFDGIHVIALYKRDCPDCQQQAPYLERLAQRFADTSLRFSVIFADVYNTDIKDKEAREKNEENRNILKAQSWVQQLDEQVRVYTSYYRYCENSNSFQEKIYCYRALDDNFEPIDNIPYILFIVKEGNDTWRFIPLKTQQLWQKEQPQDKLEEAYALLEQHTQEFWDRYKDLYPVQ